MEIISCLAGLGAFFLSMALVIQSEQKWEDSIRDAKQNFMDHYLRKSFFVLVIFWALTIRVGLDIISPNPYITGEWRPVFFVVYDIVGILYLAITSKKMQIEKKRC